MTLGLIVSFAFLAGGGPKVRSDPWFLLPIGVFAVGAGLAAVLQARPGLSVRRLRTVELVLFGGMSLQWVIGHAGLYPSFTLPDPPIWFGAILGYAVALPWCLLMIAYGILIPNAVRRTAAVVGLMAVTPLVVAAASGLASAAAGRHPPLIFYLAAAAFLGAAAALAVYGSARIERLRRAVETARQLGPYTLVRKLGSGGMGEVHLAEHRLLKRPCAVKLVRPDKAADAGILKRFEREVEAATRLTHPAAVQVYDYGREADGTFYYVMEYLPGRTLDEVVRRSGPLPAGRVIHVLRQVCGALAEAHALGLVHRDIKPANVMLGRAGGRADVAKLLDFGLVADAHAADRLTQAGGLLGTPKYLSPEQARGADVGPAADLYSLGATAYFLLTGRPPFDDSNLMKVLHAHQHVAPDPPSKWNPQVPADLEAVVVALLAKEPAARPASAAEVDVLLAGCNPGGWTPADADRWWDDAGESSADAASPTATQAWAAPTSLHPSAAGDGQT
jgi:hypothetical protein